jgi:hypothetical protein
MVKHAFGPRKDHGSVEVEQFRRGNLKTIPSSGSVSGNDEAG